MSYSYRSKSLTGFEKNTKPTFTLKKSTLEYRRLQKIKEWKNNGIEKLLFQDIHCV